MNAMLAKASTALFLLAISASQALASCPWYSSACNGSSSPAAPEIDGTAGIMALALVASIAGVLYNRGRKS